MNNDNNYIGERFGRLVITGVAPEYIAPSGGKHKRVICKCDCGSVVTVLREHITSGSQKSCGCLRRENGVLKHGEIHTRLYKIWGNMRNRCSNANNPAWENYGGRGITVCKEWDAFQVFRDWANANGYNDGLTIDRVNNNEGYCPENCRWTDNYSQANNKRANHLIIYQGEVHTIAEWAVLLGIPYKTLHRRIVGLGWKVDRAFTQPVRTKIDSAIHNSTKQNRTIKNKICGDLGIAAIGAAQATSAGRVADSAKIGRNASTICLLQDKTPEEVLDDGAECGNKKLRVILNRNGMQHAAGEYIDMFFDGNHVLYTEAKQHIPKTPF